MPQNIQEHKELKCKKMSFLGWKGNTGIYNGYWFYPTLAAEAPAHTVGVVIKANLDVILSNIIKYGLSINNEPFKINSLIHVHVHTKYGGPGGLAVVQCGFAVYIVQPPEMLTYICHFTFEMSHFAVVQ